MEGNEFKSTLGMRVGIAPVDSLNDNGDQEIFSGGGGGGSASRRIKPEPDLVQYPELEKQKQLR